MGSPKMKAFTLKYLTYLENENEMIQYNKTIIKLIASTSTSTSITTSTSTSTSTSTTNY